MNPFNQVGGLLGGLINRFTTPQNTQGLAPSTQAALQGNLGQAQKLSSPSTVQGLNKPVALGQQAKSPTQNLAVPKPLLPPAQVKTQTAPTPQSTSNGTQSNTQALPNSQTYNPSTAPSNSYASSNQPNKATVNSNINPPQYQNFRGYDAQGNAIYSAVGDQGINQPQTQQAPAQPQFTPNNGLYGQLITGLANTPANSPDVTNARQGLLDLQNQMAQQTYQRGTRPEDLGLATGEQGLLNNLFATKQAAAQTNLANALQSQGLTQDALQKAGQLAAPVANTPFFGNPVTGEVVGGAGTAQQGATIAGNVAGTQATANAQTQQIQGYQSALQQGRNLQSQATDLIKTFNLNPNELNLANGAIQKIAQNTSDSRYQTLSNYLNDIASRYAQILTPPGGSATDSTRAVATGMLNATASGQSLISVMNALDNQAQAVIAGVSTLGGQSQGQLNQSSQAILSKYRIH